jgi:hypothetical protein
MDQQCHYVGLDVSLETPHIWVIDDAGARHRSRWTLLKS